MSTDTRAGVKKPMTWWLLAIIIAILVTMGVMVVIWLYGFNFEAGNFWKSGTEPDGFRGIKWGTNILALKDMEEIPYYIGDYAIRGTYRRKNDEMRIGGAELENIEYDFWDDKLTSVTITTKGNDNWRDLKNVCFQKFGKGKKRYISEENYCWLGETTWICLSYDESSKEGLLLLQSVVGVLENREQYERKRKQEVKEGVEKGF